MAKLFATKLKDIKIYYPVENNMVFCVMHEETLSRARQKYDLKYWYKDKRVARIATTFATVEDDIANCFYQE